MVKVFTINELHTIFNQSKKNINVANIISIADIYEIRNRKKLEIEYYRKQLKELYDKMIVTKHEIDTITVIIDIIEHEKVVDLENKTNKFSS